MLLWEAWCCLLPDGAGDCYKFILKVSNDVH